MSYVCALNDEELFTGYQTSYIDTFFADAPSDVTADQRQAMRHLIGLSEEHSWDIHWGPGDTMCSFGIVIPTLPSQPVVTVWHFGHIMFNFVQLNDNEIKEHVRDSLAAFIAEHFQKVSLENYKEKFVIVDPEDWIPKVGDLIRHLRTLSAIDCN